jgi:hypothetical protein
VDTLRAANMGLRFLLELALLAGVAWWGWHAWGWWAAILLPVALAFVWGSFLSPKARWSIPLRARFALELAVFVTAAAAYYGAGGVGVAVGFGAVAAVSEILHWTVPAISPV